MKVEVTFFLVNGDEIGHVDQTEESVADVINKYGSRLGTKATIQLDDDIVISTQHITHFIAKEFEGGAEPEVRSSLFDVNGVSMDKVFRMDTPEFVKFLGDDLPKSNAEVNELAKKWDMPQVNLYALLLSHGLTDDLK